MKLCPLIVLALASHALADTRYVDDNARAGGNGQTWATAYDNLQTAIADSKATEILVAAGRYRPGDKTNDTYALRSGLAIVGGFGGETIFDGDVLGDNDALPGGFDIIDDVFNIVTANGVSHALLAGVTLTNGSGHWGKWQGGGGFKAHDSTDITVAQCRFVNNVGLHGGGAYAVNSQVRFIACDFGVNFGRYGGGLASNNADTTIIACDFAPSFPGSDIGGGLNLGGGSHTIIGCSFADMTCDGAAIRVGGATAKIIGCRFVNGEAILFGGSAIWSGSSNLEVVGCAFIGNDADDSYGGGAVWAEGGSTRIAASLFIGNVAENGNGSAVHVDRGGTLTMQANLLFGNTAPGVVVGAPNSSR